MARYIRVFIAVMMVLVLLIMAKGNAAWAADPGAGTDPSALAQAGQLVSHDDDDDDYCDKPWNKNKDKCKDKDKDKCKDKHDHHCGTVLPPENFIEACKSGTYSVGGVATVKVWKLRGHDCLEAFSRPPNPAVDKLPRKAGNILSDVVIVNSPGRGSKAQICFAVPPGKKVKIYSSDRGSLKALNTSVKKGIACADASDDGKYMLVGK